MPDTFAVIPHTGVGPLRFGMLREQVRSALPVPFEVFRRTPESIPADMFRSVWAFTYYDGAGGLVAVEFAHPAKVTFNDLDLLNTPAAKLITEMSRVDPDMEREGVGFTSKQFGFGTWSEEEGDQPPQSIIVFAPGYYDRT